ncbi:MAG: pilus assembly protein N-terminal domain-containing protein, partial [Acidobacteria bacterium]|nr:pilus assembly protein N-terminal domain-containing protein [Acidobacteriota bacterium]
AQSSVDAESEAPKGIAGSRSLVPRVTLFVREARDVRLDEPIGAVTVVDEATVSAEVIGGTTLRLKGIDFGETMVIAMTPRGRRTLLVEVIGHPLTNPFEAQRAAATAQASASSPISGSYLVSLSPPFGGAGALLNQHIEYQQKLSAGRTLRVSSDLFKFFGRKQELSYPYAASSFGLNQLSLGVSAPGIELDLLDSELDISQLSFNGYSLRGLHLVSTTDSRLRGLEVFAGMARPPLKLFGGQSGRVFGALVPLVSEKNGFRVRGGFFVASSGARQAAGRGGMVWQADARYMPNEDTKAEAEVNYAEGGLSWRGALALRRGAFNFTGEAARLDRGSPLIGIGAQPGGRVSYAATLLWLPSTRFSGSVSYSRTRPVQADAGSRTVTLSNSTLQGGISFRLSRESNLGLRYAEQQLRTGGSGKFDLDLQTRSLTASYSTRFANRWSNNFEARYTLSRDGHAGDEMERGFELQNELSRSWERWTASAFLNYASNNSSLASLVLQNPDLLPVPVRRVFEADPARFLSQYRDTLGQFLNGVEAPQTRRAEAGLRLQGAFSRYALTAETRYSSGEIADRAVRSFHTSLSMTARLDAANSVSVTASRAFIMGEGGPSYTTGATGMLTFSYVHRFGAASGGGFQFTRLLGLDRGRVKGRVFYDLNSNGVDDPDEPGLAHAKIQLDSGRTIETDAQGRFRFSSVTQGSHSVSLNADELGVELRASTPTEQQITVAPRDTVEVGFGVSNFGFIGGRVFNNLSLAEHPEMKNEPGVAGVRMRLRPADAAASPEAGRTQIVTADGEYEFRNLAPGSYLLELDLESLPPDYQPPAVTSWTLKVVPLRGTYLDVAVVAQRAVSGVVFVDVDGDGQFDPQRDEAVEGARVVAGRVEAVTGRGGAYILRNLPAGSLELRASDTSGATNAPLMIELDAEPGIRRHLNLSLKRPQN